MHPSEGTNYYAASTSYSLTVNNPGIAIYFDSWIGLYDMYEVNHSYVTFYYDIDVISYNDDACTQGAEVPNVRVLEHFSKNTRYNITTGEEPYEHILINGSRTWYIPPQNLRTYDDYHEIDIGIIVHGYSDDEYNPIIGVYENGEYAYSDACYDTDYYINGERWFGNYIISLSDEYNGNLHFAYNPTYL